MGNGGKFDDKGSNGGVEMGGDVQGSGSDDVYVYEGDLGGDRRDVDGYRKI